MTAVCSQVNLIDTKERENEISTFYMDACSGQNYVTDLDLDDTKFSSEVATKGLLQIWRRGYSDEIDSAFD